MPIFSQPPRKTRPSLGRPLVIVAALVVLAGSLALVLTDAVAERHGREEARHRATTTAATAASKLASFFDERVLRYDALHGLANVIALLDAIGGQNETLQLAEQRLRGNLKLDDHDIRQVAYTNTASRVVWSTIGGRPTSVVDLSDRFHIRAILVDRQEEYLSTPVLGRVSNETTLQFARRLAGLNGETIGVSVVSLNPEAIKLDAPAELDGLSWTLRRMDGVAVMTIGTSEVSSGLDVSAVQPTTRLHLIATATVPASVVQSWAQEVARRDRLIAMPAVGGMTVALLIAIALSALRAGRTAREHERERSEYEHRRMRAITDALPDMVVLWRIDSDRRWMAEFVSRACETMLQMPASELVGDWRWTVVEPDDRGILALRTTRIEAGEMVDPSEYRLRRADGRVVWVEVASHKFDAAASASQEMWVVSVYRDITERKRLQAEVAETRRRIELLVENSPGVFYELALRTAADGDVTVSLRYVSGTVQQFTGVSAAELMESGDLGLIMPNDQLSERWEYAKKLIGSGTLASEFDLVHRDGRRTRVRTRDVYTRVNDHFGVITGFAWDVSVETELRAELQQTAKLAFLGEMAAGMAHEMNQPLASIALQAAMLEMAMPEGIQPDERAAQKVLGRIAKITDLVRRTSAVIQRVRRFSRNERLPVGPFQPDTVINEALELMQSKLRSANVTVEHQRGTAMALGDAAGFGQVVANLISNAADAYAEKRDRMPRTIIVETLQEDGRLRTVVTDHAGGISPKVLRRLFEPFVTTKQAGSGTGLGLSICHRIMLDMGGSLTGDNYEDGARFVATLPLASAQAGEQRALADTKGAAA